MNKTKPKAVRIFATRTLDRQQRFGFKKHIAKQLLCRASFLASQLSLLRAVSALGAATQVAEKLASGEHERLALRSATQPSRNSPASGAG